MTSASIFIQRLLKKDDGIDDVTILRTFLDCPSEFQENYELFKKFGDSRDEVELFIEEFVFLAQRVIQQNITFYQTCKIVLLLYILDHKAIITEDCKNCTNIMASTALILTISPEVYPHFIQALSFLDE